MSVNLQIADRSKAKLYLLYLSRSDGKSEITVRKGATETNMPTPDQLLKQKLSSGLYTFYQEIPIGDPKHMDWRRKLGGLLAKEAHRQMKEKGELPGEGPFSKDEIQMEEFCLADFPENYRLWEHRRSANLDNPNAPSRNDRRDAYLYGHPLGRKKRFRSPADFYYHLEWLAFDSEGDPENCRCKICSPDEVLKAAEEMRSLQVKLYGSAEAKAALKAQSTESNGPSQPNLAAGITQISLEPNTRRLIQPNTTSRSMVGSAPEPIPPPKNTSQTSTPSMSSASPAPKSSDPIPLVPPRHPEQVVDQMTNSFIYRVGELVWFSRDNGAVGLATIIQRHHSGDNVNGHQSVYLLQPLSHPFKNPDRVSINDERRIVPWLAYSTPPCTHKALQDTNLHYDNIKWEQFVNDTAGDAEVDGSIYAAKAVDQTFTPVHRLPLPEGPMMEIGYNGLYLGGELIWVGEAVRLRTEVQKEKGNGIMIVSRIIERLRTGSKPSDIYLVGDTYELRTVRYNPARPHPPNRYLPERVQEDLKYRNVPRIVRRGEEMHWKFLEGQQRLPLNKISGRWYESKTVLPIIQGEAPARQQIETGDIPDVTPFLNVRGASTVGDGQAGTRKADRRLAFSKSIPSGTKFHIDFEETSRQPQPQPPHRAPRPISATPTPPGHQPNQVADSGSFGFINMDQMDESGYPQAF